MVELPLTTNSICKSIKTTKQPALLYKKEWLCPRRREVCFSKTGKRVALVTAVLSAPSAYTTRSVNVLTCSSFPGPDSPFSCSENLLKARAEPTSKWGQKLTQMCSSCKTRGLSRNWRKMGIRSKGRLPHRPNLPEFCPGWAASAAGSIQLQQEAPLWTVLMLPTTGFPPGRAHKWLWNAGSGPSAQCPLQPQLMTVEVPKTSPQTFWRKIPKTWLILHIFQQKSLSPANPITGMNDETSDRVITHN